MFVNFKRFIRLMLSGINTIPLRLRNNKISWTAEVRGKSYVHGCYIGQYSFVGPGCNLLNVELGNYCSIAPGVQIGGMEHAISDLSTNTWLSNKGDDSTKTIIEDDVWIAGGSIIRQGIRIGGGAVVGANSFVNKEVPPYAIVAGTPANVIRYRFDENIINDLLSSDYSKETPKKASEILDKLRTKHNIK